VCCVHTTYIRVLLLGLFCNEIYDGDGSPMASASSNLAASWFGYAVGNMAELGFADVGQDQLAGGPSPDNEQVVSMLDWTTGQPNAKYFSVQVRTNERSRAMRAQNTMMSNPLTV
jgi:hypothetical protein